MKYTEERKPIINILFFVISMSSLFIMPSVFYTIMRMFFEDSLTLQFLSELFAIVLLFLIRLSRTAVIFINHDSLA